ncbi:MAG TPA: FAD-dependent oxidoreductase [Gaiellaceae bacterium]|nr:FAD-dependent oxidoreductase [Gaiellaceae bacterium]
MSDYPHLFSPLRIGNVTVRNRIMQTAHVKLWAWNGVDSDRNVAYQAARAKGGAGLLITGNRVVHPTSTTGFPRVAWAYRPEALEADRRLTSAVHEHGGVIFAQLNHFGLNASSDSADDLRVLWGPSAVKSPAYGETPKAMEPEDIREVVEWWGRSAELTRDGGFDGTEVHISHSYLLHQFLSPLYNKRDDEYGGSLENRLRFAREVIEEVRTRAGSDWVVGVRISLTDFIPGALDIEDAIAVARMLEQDGRIDYVNVTAAGYHNIFKAIEPADVPDGYLVELAAQVKQAVVRLPVFTVGGIKDPVLAEEILAAGKADMVAMTRAQIADPEFARKVREGREDEIVHCIRGNQGCIGRVFKGLPIACTVNPGAGRERLLGPGTLTPTAVPRRWVVAGGGPAGMKAASVLAERGHEVTLLEQADRLGGQVNLILRTPGRDEFGWITRDLERQLERNGVDVRLGQEATAELVHALEPHGVVVATGALPSRTGFSSVNPLAERLPGAEQEHVLTVWDVLLETRPVGERVVVLDDDGTRYAAGVTEVLLDRGCRVELVSRWPSLFPTTLTTLDMAHLYRRLLGKGLEYRLNTWASAIDGARVRVFNLYTGATDVLEVDTVVLATGQKANDALYLALKGRVENLHRIGDCLAPRKLDHAIYEGELAGRELWSPEERFIYEGDLERGAEVPLQA